VRSCYRSHVMCGEHEWKGDGGAVGNLWNAGGDCLEIEVVAFSPGAITMAVFCVRPLTEEP
jgi:hypothetical protein